MNEEIDTQMTRRAFAGRMGAMKTLQQGRPRQGGPR
jgi:hypothetical protein